MNARLMSLVALLLGLAGSACAPLVRYGDIEQDKGERTLVEVRVIPTDHVAPPEVLLATGRGAMRRLLLPPAPRVPADVVQAEMASEVQGLDVPAKRARVDTAELGGDARRVESMYAARGYFRARLERTEVVDLGNGNVRFDVYLEEGPPTIVHEVVFAGVTPPDDDPDAVERLAALGELMPEVARLEPGDVWNEDDYLRSLDALQGAYRAKGFIHATVTGESFVSREKNLAAVRFDIDHGPLVRADGNAIITGNGYVPKARVRRRVTVADGVILEAETLRETEQQVFDLGPFFSVQARAQRGGGELAVIKSDEPAPAPTPAPAPDTTAPPPAPDAPAPVTPPTAPTPDDGVVESDLPSRVPVEVKLTTTSRWELTVGPAAVTDGERLELGLPVAFTHRALFGEVLALRASVKPALVFPEAFSGQACCDEREFGLLAKLGLDAPSFLEEYLRLTTQVSYELDQKDPKNEEVAARVGLSRRLGSGFTLAIGYDISQVFYFASGPLQTLDAALARDASAFRFKESDRVMWLGASLVFDRRDGVYDAKNGIFASLGVDGGHGAIGSTVEFLRTSFEVRGFLTLDALPWLTVAGRVKAGLTFYPGSQGTPASIRFESGGPNAHRGFNTDRMGDYVCIRDEEGVALLEPQIGSDFSATNPPCPDVADSRIYIGGNYVFEANLEVRFQPGTLGVVLFMDAGRLWSRYRDIDLGDLFVAIGPGLRLATPVGPVRLDVGLLLGRDRAREFHFSLGQAF